MLRKEYQMKPLERRKCSSVLLTLGLVAALAATSGAAAQAPAASASAAESPARHSPDKTLAETLKTKDARVSNLIGKRVTSPSGDDLGEIEDLLVMPDRARPPTVVISVGGVLDVGDKWFATSFDELIVPAESDSLILDKSEDELEKAPPFDYLRRAGESSGGPGAVGAAGANSISALLGATVVDERGESIGEIDDLVVSARDPGTQAIVELNSGGGREADDRLVAIPFDELQIETSGEEARGVPQQPRVRAELEDTPLDALPAYEYSRRDLI
jgi:sporulation protein YlmC with PRC-barrel domain